MASSRAAHPVAAQRSCNETAFPRHSTAQRFAGAMSRHRAGLAGHGYRPTGNHGYKPTADKPTASTRGPGCRRFPAAGKSLAHRGVDAPPGCHSSLVSAASRGRRDTLGDCHSGRRNGRLAQCGVEPDGSGPEPTRRGRVPAPEGRRHRWQDGTNRDPERRQPLAALGMRDQHGGLGPLATRPVGGRRTGRPLSAPL
jgi:hypothetical protein